MRGENGIELSQTCCTKLPSRPEKMEYSIGLNRNLIVDFISILFCFLFFAGVKLAQICTEISVAKVRELHCIQIHLTAAYLYRNYRTGTHLLKRLLRT